MKIKLVLNKRYGGFSLSKAAYEYLGLNWEDDYGYNDYYFYNRTDEKLIKCVEELGDLASGESAKLVVKEIEFVWKINSFDGIEEVCDLRGFEL